MCGPGVVHHMMRDYPWTLLVQSCSLHCKSGVLFWLRTLERGFKFTPKFLSNINSTPQVHVNNKTEDSNGPKLCFFRKKGKKEGGEGGGKMDYRERKKN